jgi:hypothetical protein
MMSPHTHVALTRVRDREAVHRPDAKPDREPAKPVAAIEPTRARRGLAWLHLSRPRHVSSRPVDSVRHA